jgi:glutathione S-transferase
MVLKLYGSALSTCTRRAAVVFHEKNAPFEFHPIDMSKGAHKSPEYMEKQPFGQVPYLVRLCLIIP